MGLGFGVGATPATANTLGPHTVLYTIGGLKDITLRTTGGACNLGDTALKISFVNVIAATTAQNINFIPATWFYTNLKSHFRFVRAIC